MHISRKVRYHISVQVSFTSSLSYMMKDLLYDFGFSRQSISCFGFILTATQKMAAERSSETSETFFTNVLSQNWSKNENNVDYLYVELTSNSLWTTDMMIKRISNYIHKVINNKLHLHENKLNGKQKIYDKSLGFRCFPVHNCPTNHGVPVLRTVSVA
jgi:hypothetical protein